MQNSVISTRNTSLYGSQPSSVVFVRQRSDFWTRIISLYWSQTSPVILWMQSNVISIRITSLCRSQTSPVVFACKTAWLASELLFSMGPSPHRCFLHANSDFWTRNTSLYLSQTSSVVLCIQNCVISSRITSFYGFQPSSVVLCIQNNDVWT